MAKKKKPNISNERFGDWSAGNIIPLEPGQVLVNDDPIGDPYKFAYQGEENPHLPPKPDKAAPKRRR